MQPIKCRNLHILVIIIQCHREALGAYIRRSSLPLPNLGADTGQGNISLISITNPPGHREQHCTLSNKEPRLVPRGFNCPRECPFGATIARDRCSKVCIRGDLCGEIHPAKLFPDPETGMCTATCGDKLEDRISGCAVCESVGKCKECSTVLFSGFQLSEDGKECTPKQGLLWPIVYCIIGIVALLIALYLLTMTFRPTINEGTLDTAMKHRNQCRPLQSDNSSYPLFFTDVHNTEISGVGVMLYFKWVRFVLFIALALLVITCSVYWTSKLATNTGHHERHEDGDCKDALAGGVAGHHQAEAAEDHHEKSMGKYDEFNKKMFWAMFGASIIIPVIVLFYSWRQSKWAHDRRQNDHKPHVFAVKLRGFAPEETDPLPIVEYFENLLNQKMGPPNTPGHSHIVGVSICYEFLEDQEIVQEAIEAWVVQEDSHHKSHRAINDQDSPGADVSERRKKVTYALKVADPYLFFVAPSGGSLESEDELQERMKDVGDRITPVLKNMTNSGEAYLVCSHTAAVEEILGAQLKMQQILGAHPELVEAKEYPTYEYHGQTLKVRPVQAEAHSVNFWAHTRESNFHDTLLGIAVLAATIALWAALYLPYALDYIAFTSVPGRSPNFFEDLLLGLLIAVGNVIVANVIEIVVPWWRHKGKDRRDMMVLSMGFMATLLNTACDLWLVMEIAKGHQVNDAFGGEDTGYDRVLAAELMVLIVPGYLVVPYVLTPFFEHVLPYICVHSVVRTRMVARRQAELGLEHPPFDLCWRYSDICNNFTICTTMLCFVTPNAWKVFGFLTLFVVLIYVIDYFKMMRFTSQTYYTAHRLSDAFSCWFGIPMAAISGVATWWAMKCDYLPHVHALMMFIPAMFLVVYLSILYFLLKHSQFKITDATYHQTQLEMAEKGKTFDYFNCNPIFCLRQKWFGINEPCGRQRIVPYVSGKYYLQRLSEIPQVDDDDDDKKK